MYKCSGYTYYNYMTQHFHPPVVSIVAKSPQLIFTLSTVSPPGELFPTIIILCPIIREVHLDFETK